LNAVERSAYHEGELRIQERLGVTPELAARVKAAIRNR
jgi:hypothetical protein